VEDQVIKKPVIGTVHVEYTITDPVHTHPAYMHLTSGRKDLLMSNETGALFLHEPVSQAQDEWLLWDDHRCVDELGIWSDAQLNDPLLKLVITGGSACAMPIEKAVAHKLGIKGEDR
jgi:hypothetical protein